MDVLFGILGRMERQTTFQSRTSLSFRILNYGTVLYGTLYVLRSTIPSLASESFVLLKD